VERLRIVMVKCERVLHLVSHLSDGCQRVPCSMRTGILSFMLSKRPTLQSMQQMASRAS
jgi:hypothetical protein